MEATAAINLRQSLLPSPPNNSENWSVVILEAQNLHLVLNVGNGGMIHTAPMIQVQFTTNLDHLGICSSIFSGLLYPRLPLFMVAMCPILSTLGPSILALVALPCLLLEYLGHSKTSLPDKRTQPGSSSLFIHVGMTLGLQYFTILYQHTESQSLGLKENLQEIMGSLTKRGFPICVLPEFWDWSNHMKLPFLSVVP